MIDSSGAARLGMHFPVHNDLNYIHRRVFKENEIETSYM